VSPDEKTIDYLLADKMQSNKVELLEGMPDPAETDKIAKPQESDQSFILGNQVKKKPLTVMLTASKPHNGNTQKLESQEWEL
jgi:hypothetical protein